MSLARSQQLQKQWGFLYFCRGGGCQEKWKEYKTREYPGILLLLLCRWVAFWRWRGNSNSLVIMEFMEQFNLKFLLYKANQHRNRKALFLFMPPRQNLWLYKKPLAKVKPQGYSVPLWAKKIMFIFCLCNVLITTKLYTWLSKPALLNNSALTDSKWHQFPERIFKSNYKAYN